MRPVQVLSTILLGCGVVLAGYNPARQSGDFPRFYVPQSSRPVQVRDIEGKLSKPFEPEGKANVLFFVCTDCPVSNSYAPEIQRLCREYGTKGVGCSLIYEDLDITAATVRKHLGEYRYQGIRAVIDRDRNVATRANAVVTPEAVVIAGKGEIRYRGRIDNFYAALGKPRQQVTVHDVRAALDAILAGKPVLNPETKAFGCYIVSPDVLNHR